MTRNERKYRAKIIQENHLNKESQRSLDRVILLSPYLTTYKEYYDKKYNIPDITETFSQICISIFNRIKSAAEILSDAFISIGEGLESFAKSISL